MTDAEMVFKSLYLLALAAVPALIFACSDDVAPGERYCGPRQDGTPGTSIYRCNSDGSVTFMEDCELNNSCFNDNGNVTCNVYLMLFKDLYLPLTLKCRHWRHNPGISL